MYKKIHPQNKKSVYFSIFLMSL